MMIDHQLIHSVLNWVETVALELQLKQLSSIHILSILFATTTSYPTFLHILKKIVAISIVVYEGIHDVNKPDSIG